MRPIVIDNSRDPWWRYVLFAPAFLVMFVWYVGFQLWHRVWRGEWW